MVDNLTDKQMLETVQRVTDAVRRKALEIYLEKAGQRKTEGTYNRQVWRIIRDLYNSEIDEFQFVDDFNSFIDNQFGRAWREGARDMGVNPNQFTDKDIEPLAQRIEAEQGYMLQLADDILKAREEGTPALDSFRARADSYSNRYNDMVNMAHAHFGGKQMLKWNYDPSKEHCHMNDKPGKWGCAELNGIVASANDWKDAGVRPQGSMLACWGGHCGCSLDLTDEPPTPGGIPHP